MIRSETIVGIAAKPFDPLGQYLSRELIAWLSERSLDYRLDRTIAAELGPTDFSPHKVVERRDLTAVCDPIVVLGGDGTLLSVCRHAFKGPPTVVGVNIGRLGFLAEISVDEIYSTLESVLNGKANFETRFLLQAQVFRDGELLSLYHAVNDVVLTKEALARIFGIDITFDGETVSRIRGDGLIIATPLGSTAYSMAAGGSIVHPNVEGLLLTPICPHSLTSRPVVIPGTTKVSLRLAETDPVTASQVILTVDGQEGIGLTPRDEIVVTTSSRSFRLVTSPSRTYFEILEEKLNWGTVAVPRPVKGLVESKDGDEHESES